MRVFFDSNVLISVAISQGTCHKVFQHCLGRHPIYTSPFVLKEVGDKLLNKLKITPKKITKFIAYLHERCYIGKDSSHPEKVSRDPKDNPIIAAAHGVAAYALITGDKDLLVLKRYKATVIVSPGTFKTIDSSFEG